MKILVLTLLLSISQFADAKNHKHSEKKAKDKAPSTKAEVNPYGDYFENEDIQVEVAKFSKKNSDGLHDVLIKITGAPAHDAGIDGKVILHIAEPAGTGVDFKFKRDDGSQGTRMLTRQSWGSWSFFEVFLNGKTYKVYKNPEKSKGVRPQHLLTAYNDGKKK